MEKQINKDKYLPQSFKHISSELICLFLVSSVFSVDQTMGVELFLVFKCIDNLYTLIHNYIILKYPYILKKNVFFVGYEVSWLFINQLS